MSIIPYDKYWILQMGILDMINDKDSIFIFLENNQNITEELKNFKITYLDWTFNKNIVYVGYSNYIYYVLIYIIYKKNLNIELFTDDNIKKINDNEIKKILDFSQNNLIDLGEKDIYYIYFASALILLGDEERLDSPPLFIKKTYKIVDEWNKSYNMDENWDLKYDPIIEHQFNYLKKYNSNNHISFIPKYSEDFFYYSILRDNLKIKKNSYNCFNKIKQNLLLLKEIKDTLYQYKTDKTILSKNDRIIQAIVIKSILEKKNIKVKYPNCVQKSWNNFWNYFSNKFNKY